MTSDKTRREWTLLAAAGSASGILGGTAPSAIAQPAPGRGTPLHIAMLVHPDRVLLDLVGPLTVFSLMQAEIHLVWKEPLPVSSDVGLPVILTMSFSDCPADLDVLFVPGGLKGSVALINDAQVLGFLADRSSRAA
jgi:cyclohexyl-isocyanide hydratase